MVNEHNVDSIFTTMPSGVGITEAGVHPASGLRSFIHSGEFASDDTCVASAPIVTTTTWKVLPLDFAWGTYSQTASPQTYTPYRKNLPFPCTPCITYRQTNGTPAETQTFSVKIWGRNQFGTAIYEQILNQVVADSTHTPGVPSAPYVRRTRLWCSQVFSAIERVEYLASAQGTSDFLDVGVYWDFDVSGATAPYENYIGQSNQGVGTIGYINAYTQYTSGTTGLVYPDLMGIELVNLDPQVFPIISGANATPTTYAIGLGFQAVTAFSVANPTVMTVTTGFTRTAGTRFRIRVAGDTLHPYLNGDWVATAVNGSTTMSLPVNVASTHSSYTGIKAMLLPADVPFDRNVPVFVGGLASANPAGLNGFHESVWSSSVGFAVPFAGVANGTATSSYVHVLRQPTASVQAYNSSVTGLLATGGFRLGTNASGFRGTPHKWNIYKAVAGSTYYPGLPIKSSNLRIEADGDVDGVPDDLHQFPWERNQRIGFRAYYHTSYGARSASSHSSYGQSP